MCLIYLMTVVRLNSPNNSHLQQYILLQARCEFEGCRAYLVDPAGHDTCRVHSFCAQRTADGAIAWHPDECEVCYRLWASISSDQVILINTNNDTLFTHSVLKVKELLLDNLFLVRIIAFINSINSVFQ